jgi:hypothetical protein
MKLALTPQADCQIEDLVNEVGNFLYIPFFSPLIALIGFAIYIKNISNEK